jgi:uncharacterized protein (TIGR03435 family)
MTLKPVTGFCALLILSAICTLSRSAPAQTMQKAAQPDKDFKYDVVSIRPRKGDLSPTPFGTESDTPNGTYIEGISMNHLLLIAYSPVDIEQSNTVKIINVPSWTQSERYDINARVSPEDQEIWQNPHTKRAYLRSATRHMLNERCKAKVQIEPTLIPYLSLRVDEHHNKLVAVSEIPSAPDDASRLPSGGYVERIRDQDGNFVWKFYGSTMGDLTNFVQGLLGDLTQDKTSLTGRYNFQFSTISEAWAENKLNAVSGLRKLGFRITNDKGPGYNVVVDHIERPDPN